MAAPRLLTMQQAARRLVLLHQVGSLAQHLCSLPKGEPHTPQLVGGGCRQRPPHKGVVVTGQLQLHTVGTQVLRCCCRLLVEGNHSFRFDA